MLRTSPPIHPGEILREEFLVPFDLSAGKLAKALGVPRSRIERIVREETEVTTDTALRLSRYFGMSDGFWLNLQKSYELSRAHADPALQAEVARIAPREAA